MQTRTFSGANSGEIVFDPIGTRIFQAGEDGFVRVFDTLTGEIIHEWEVGGSLGAMAFDGGNLVIFDTEMPIMYYVDTLRSGQVTAIEYEPGPGEGLITDVASFTNLRSVVFVSSLDDGPGTLKILDFNLAQFTTLGSAQAGSTLSSSIFGGIFNEVLLTEADGAVRIIQDPVSGPVTISSNTAIFDGLSASAQSNAADFIAIATSGVGVSIVDRSFSLVQDLSGLNLGPIDDLAFSADGEELYILSGAGSTISTVKTSDWSLVGSLNTGLQLGGDLAASPELMVDPRGQFLTVETGSTFVLIENPNAPPIEGEVFPDQLVGTVFGDVIFGFGGRDEIEGGDGADVIHPGTDADIVDGGSNVDTVVVSGNFEDYTIEQNPDRPGRFSVFNDIDVNNGGSFDSLRNVEFVQFDDRLVRLIPGTGISVDFESADPSVYADAANRLRDFNGNDLGGDGSWLRIGSVDVNGDGDIDQILVNDAIGRFATVGTAEDGLVYFDDHGWAGETRVAGIYIDPLVQSGDVDQGGPFDSQRRFQNDLRIDNINEVLGSNDYNGDGIWEVYFALTDGTAYLRALMHADGNIRYANYQSEEQVRNYLEANGFGEETFGDWFPSDADGQSGQGGEDEKSAVSANAPEIGFATPAFTEEFSLEAGTFWQGSYQEFPTEFFG